MARRFPLRDICLTAGADIFRLTGERDAIISARLPWNGDWEQVKTQEQLKDELSAMKRQGRLPALINVDPDKPPFNSVLPTWLLKLFGDSDHEAVAVDFDPVSGDISYSTNWGKVWDGKTSYKEMFRALRSGG